MEELKKRIHDDSNGLDYVLVGDYYIVFLPLFQPLELVLFLKKLSFSLFFFGSKLVEGFRFCHVS